MTTLDRTAIRRSIREQDPSHEILSRVEHGGDESFDFIRTELETNRLSPQQRVNALRRLALLIRHKCRSRTEELLELAVLMCQEDSPVSRGGAVRMVIGVTEIIEKFPKVVSAKHYQAGSQPSLRDEMRAVVRAASERGVDEETKAMVRSF